jgi:signal transduction histidine kinase
VSVAAPAISSGPASRGLRQLGVANIAAGLILSVGVFTLVHVHLDPTDPHGSVLAGIAAVPMTLPVLWARRSPLTAAAVVAVASLANWIFVGHYIRCGAAIPAAFWIACVLGFQVRDRRWIVGLGLIVIDLLVQGFADPQITPPTIFAAGPIAIGFWFAGRAIRGRADAIRQVAQQNKEIAATREKRVQLAVDLERERIATGLDTLLQRRISGMGAQAAAARGHVRDADNLTASTFASIAADGRQTLADMREVVGSLRNDSPLAPQPDMNALAELVGRGGGRLQIDGNQRQIPSSVEVSAYRIVEQLLRAAAADPANPVDVRVTFTPDELELRVSATVGATGTRESAEPGPELAVVRQRVSFHGGSLATDALPGRLQWVARLPLTADHG